MAFRATDNALQELFAEAGTVVSASITTRGRRALGYGFVDMSTQEEAEAAVEKLNGREFCDRTLKVELAKDPSERPPKAKKTKKAAVKKTEATSDSSSDATESEVEGKTSEKKGSRSRQNKKKGAPRAPREKKAPRPKVESETTVFVANLPFSIDDEGLLALFKEAGAQKAHVVRTRNNRSRGYGFVEFADKDAQTAGIEKMNGFEVEGESGTRSINCSISTSTAPDDTDADADVVDADVVDVTATADVDVDAVVEKADE